MSHPGSGRFRRLRGEGSSLVFNLIKKAAKRILIVSFDQEVLDL